MTLPQEVNVDKEHQGTDNSKPVPLVDLCEDQQDDSSTDLIPEKDSVPQFVALGKEENQSRIFRIDGVSLTRHSRFGIRVECWECGGFLSDFLELQDHLIQRHGGSECPGKRCGGCPILPNMNTKLSMHLEAHHLWTTCPQGHVVHLREYDNHLNNDCLEDNHLTILSNNSISFPTDIFPLKKVKGGRSNYYLDGQICTVDGIHYVIRQSDYSIFVDCPLCKEGLALSLLASHIYEDHVMALEVPCLSPNCSSKSIRPSDLRQHLIDEHSSLRCKECCWPLTIIEVQHHLSNRCPARIKDTGPVLPRAYPTLACPICSVEVLNLNEHIRKKHFGRVKCIACSKIVKKSKLTDHMKSHHDEKKDLHYKKCPICSADVFKLDNHMSIMHSYKKKQEEAPFLKMTEP